MRDAAQEVLALQAHRVEEGGGVLVDLVQPRDELQELHQIEAERLGLVEVERLEGRSEVGARGARGERGQQVPQDVVERSNECISNASGLMQNTIVLESRRPHCRILFFFSASSKERARGCWERGAGSAAAGRCLLQRPVVGYVPRR